MWLKRMIIFICVAIVVVVAVNFVKKYLDSERTAEMNGKEWEESNFIEEETGRSRKRIFK